MASAWAARCDEVIVADGGSSDRTCELAKTLKCTVLSTDRGRAIQQNAGAKNATGDVLLFLHADNWLSDVACDQIRKTLTEQAAICGAFRQQIQSPRMVFRWLERGNAWRADWLGRPYGDQGIFVRRDAFFTVGGFPAVPLLEDLLLMKRLRKISRPRLLPGPIYVSPRRWRKHGVVRQTLRNWSILLAHSLGVSPNRLARFYVGHALHDASS